MIGGLFSGERRIGQLLVVMLLAFGLVSVAVAQDETMLFEEEPTLFVTIEPPTVFTGGAYVQGEIVLTVRITSLHPFEALNVEMPKIDGVRIDTLLKPRMRRVKAYTGTGYVLEQAIAIYPQSSGRLVIPPVRATGIVEPEKDKPLNFTDASPELVLDIEGISPRFKGDWWLVSRSVTLTEAWSKPPEELREGDVVRRTMTLIARGVPHTRMKMPEHGRTRGIEFADAGGSGSTQRTGDGVIGTLVHSWDLKIGVGATLYIAPMGVHYWDPTDGASKKASVRGYRIEPLPADEQAIAETLLAEASRAHSGARQLAILSGALILAPFGLTLLLSLWAIVPTKADRTLRRTLGQSLPDDAVYRAVADWARDSEVSDSDLAMLSDRYANLQARLFGRNKDEPGPSAIAADLLAAGRDRRLRRVFEQIGRFASQLVGQTRGLNRGG